MSSHRNEKRDVRRRMALTGEPWTVALANHRAGQDPWLDLDRLVAIDPAIGEALDRIRVLRDAHPDATVSQLWNGDTLAGIPPVRADVDAVVGFLRGVPTDAIEAAVVSDPRTVLVGGLKVTSTVPVGELVDAARRRDLIADRADGGHRADLRTQPAHAVVTAAVVAILDRRDGTR